MKVLLGGMTQDTASTVLAILQGAGFSAEEADSVADVESVVRHGEFDLIVLNAPPGAMDMTQSIRAIRNTKTKAPILVMISSPVFATAAVLGAGADDVMQVSVARTELAARCRALVRRSHGMCNQLLTVGPLTLDLDNRDATIEGRHVNLTGREFAVLEILAMRRNRAVRKEAIVAGIYALEGDEPDSKIIDVFICKVRRKLAKAGAPNLITTVWGVGYRLQDPAVAEEGMSVTPRAVPAMPMGGHPALVGAAMRMSM
jgi:two-component system cell cycle response regulator CtrA